MLRRARGSFDHSARCGSCDGCSIEDPSQLHNVDSSPSPPEELVHQHFAEVFNVLPARYVYKQWVTVFDEFNFLWQVDGADRRQLMPWMYSDWNHSDWMVGTTSWKILKNRCSKVQFSGYRSQAQRTIAL